MLKMANKALSFSYLYYIITRINFVRVVFEPCDTWPCKNGGDCENEGTRYKCTCKDHFMGTRCESKSYTYI